MNRRDLLLTLAGLPCLSLAGGPATAQPLARAAGARQIPGAAPAADWKLLAYRTREELDTGVFYGDPEQFLQGLVRAPSDPDRIYAGQDVGPFLRSDDGGASWQVCVARGMKNAYFTACAVDPVDKNLVMTLTHTRASTTAALQTGLWRSADGGVTFTRVLATEAQGEAKIIAQTIAHAPSSTDQTGARRWYAAYPDRDIKTGDPSDSGFWRSDDRGLTWSRVQPALPVEIYGDVIYEVKVSPQDQDMIWMGSNTGLFRSQDAGRSWDRIAAPILPEGTCSHIEIDPETPGRIFVSIAKQGGYYTADGFATPAVPLFEMPDLRRAFPHPADWDICYRLPERGRGLGSFAQAEVSTDMLTRLTRPGADPDWTRAEVPKKPGNDASWWREITGEPSYVSWDPRDKVSALAVSRGHFFRTENLVDWVFSNKGHAGFNYGGGAINTEFAFDHFDSARIFLPHSDIGILYTTDRFQTYAQSAEYRTLALASKSTKTTCVVCALQPVPGATRIVAAIGDYNSSTMVFSGDGGASWSLVGPGKQGKQIRCWSIHYALTEPDHCYVHRWRSTDGGETFTELASLKALGAEMMIIGVSRTAVSGTIPALYAVDHRGPRAYCDLWTSVDRGETWKKALSLGRGDKLYGLGDSQPVFRVDPVDPHGIFTIAPSSLRGAVAGSISRYDTATGRWTHYDIWQAMERLSDNGARHIAIDPYRPVTHPKDSLILYVRLQHGGMRNVLRSLDGGATWENMTYDGTNAVGQGFEVNPATGELFIGGEAGTRMLPPPYATSGTVGEQAWAMPDNIALTP